MKIELKHPITHDGVNYGRGVHAFPDKLAQKLLAEAPHAAVAFVLGTNDVAPGSVTLPNDLSKGELQDKILVRIGALKDRRNRLEGSGLSVDEIDGDIGVLQWQLRCVETLNASDETLADHLRQLDRQQQKGAPTPAENPARARSKPHATQLKKPAIPPKRQDLSRYFDAVNLTATQRDYLSLRFEHDLSVTEIARLRNKHHSSVQEALSRGETKLKSIPDPRLAADMMRRESEDEVLERIDQERAQNKTHSHWRRSDDPR